MQYKVKVGRRKSKIERRTRPENEWMNVCVKQVMYLLSVGCHNDVMRILEGFVIWSEFRDNFSCFHFNNETEHFVLYGRMIGDLRSIDHEQLAAFDWCICNTEQTVANHWTMVLTMEFAIHRIEALHSTILAIGHTNQVQIVGQC